jgi:hypothetical protein
LIEMIITVAIAGVLFTVWEIQNSYDSKVKRGEQLATVVKPYYEAIHEYTRKYRLALQTGVAIPGVANPLQPTVVELQSLNVLASTYSTTLNYVGGSPVYRVERLPTGCVGLLCDLSYLFTTALPLRNAKGTVSEGILSYAARRIGGTAGYTDFAAPGTFTGTGGWTAPNPNGAVAGILGVYQTYSASGDANFLTVGDARDPGFTGGATITGGTTSVAGLAVTGTAAVSTALTVGNCVDINGVNGRAGFGCLNKDSLPAGYTGGVVSPDVVVSRNLLVSDNRAGFTGNNTNYALATANDGSGQAALSTSGRVAGDRLVPRGSYTPGTPCAAADEAAIARNAIATGSVSCVGGTWRAQFTYATAGAPCSPNGSMATAPTGEKLICINGSYVSMDNLFQAGTPGSACSTLNAEGIDLANGYGKLLCRRNLADGSTTLRWFRLADVTTQLQFVASVEVQNGSTLNAPACPVAAGQTAQPVAQLRPSRAESSSDGGFTRVAVPSSPSTWQIVLQNGSGAPLTSNTGNAVSVAETYCYYP